MIELYLARRYLFRGQARHISFIGIISSVGIVLGVATVIVALSIINGIDGGLMERVMRFKEHLTVESVDEESLYKVKDAVNQWDEVEFASLSVQTQVFARFDETIMPLVVKGMDFNDPKIKNFFYQYVTQDNNTDGFFLGESLRRRCVRDDKLEYYPLQRRLKVREDNIRGFFKIGLYDIDNYYVIADLEKTKSLSEHYQFFLGVQIKEPFKAGEIKQRILKEFPGGFYVSTWIESNEALFATLKLEKLAMFIILILIVIVASFNIFATLTVKVVEKTKEIGILKSIGFTSSRVMAVFTLQGVIIGLIGVVGGSVLGVGICFILEKYPFIRLPEEIFFTEYLPVKVKYMDVALISVIGLCISFVSSLLPAIRAARLSPCDALRYE